MSDGTTPPPSAVLIDEHDGVAVLLLNRSETRNALSTEVLAGLLAGLEWAEERSTVRAVVITGGTTFFAAGADLRELRATTPAKYLQSERQKVWPRLASFKKPVIAGVAGFALGGGCGLALSCDLIVAADSAVFGQPEIRLGIIPGAGGTQRWARAAGRFQAAGLVLTGRNVDAWTAHQMGVVHQVVPAECVIEAAIEVAQDVAQWSGIATRLGKAAIRGAEEVGVSAGLDMERALLAVLLSSEDHSEGIDAFLEKREPKFKGY